MRAVGILVFRLKSSRDSGLPSKIGTIPPNSGRLDTLQGFLGGPEACSPVKNRNLRYSNCWKCIEIVNPTITTLVLYHFKSFTIPSGGPFWFPRAPPPPPAYGPEMTRQGGLNGQEDFMLRPLKQNNGNSG